MVPEPTPTKNDAAGLMERADDGSGLRPSCSGIMWDGNVGGEDDGVEGRLAALCRHAWIGLLPFAFPLAAIKLEVARVFCGVS